MPFLFIFNIYPLQLFFIDLVCIYACMQYLHFGSEGSLQQCDENATPYNSLPFKQLQFYSISSNNFIALLQRNYMAVQRSAKNCTNFIAFLKRLRFDGFKHFDSEYLLHFGESLEGDEGIKVAVNPHNRGTSTGHPRQIDRQVDRQIDRR